MVTEGIHYKSLDNRKDMQEWLNSCMSPPARFYLLDVIDWRKLSEETSLPIYKVKYESFDISEVFSAWHDLYRSSDRMDLVCSYECFKIDDTIDSGETFMWRWEPVLRGKPLSKSELRKRRKLQK